MKIEKYYSTLHYGYDYNSIEKEIERKDCFWN